MKTAKTLPQRAYLEECVAYDSDTGILIWRKRPASHFATRRGWSVWNARFAGTMCGCLHKPSGYIFLSIDDSKYKAHRIIWRLMTGDAPVEVDHRNGDKSDNRWDNLREATRSNNLGNSRARTRVASGIKGVYFDKRRALFYSRIQCNKQGKYLGYFSTAEAAKKAYDAAAKQLFGEFAHT